MAAELYKGQVIGYVFTHGADPRGQGTLKRVWRVSTATTAYNFCCMKFYLLSKLKL
jgi:hypothetical protein